MKHVQKRLLSAVVAMMLVCSVLPVNMLAAEEEAAAESAAEAVVETTTPEPQEPTAVIDNNDLADSVVSTPAEEPVTEEPTVEEPAEEETIAEEPSEEEATEPTEETTEPVEEISEEESVEANLVDEEAPKTDEQTPADDEKLEDAEWTVSKSKTATNLDKNYETNVTLSLPSGEKKLQSDIVLVLDKSTSDSTQEQAINMLDTLRDELKDKDAIVKVAVVKFNNTASYVDYLNLMDDEDYEAIKAAIGEKVSSGTNAHAGLLKGMELLDTSKADPDRRYLIFVSDGLTYLYNDEEGNPTGIYGRPGEEQTSGASVMASPNYEYAIKQTGATTEEEMTIGFKTWTPDDWVAYMNEIGQALADEEHSVSAYEHPYGTASSDLELGEYLTLEQIKSGDYVVSPEKSMYLTYQAYKAAAAKYNCYAVLNQNEDGTPHSAYQYGIGFMNFLAELQDSKGGSGNVGDAFKAIQKDIYYLLDTDSKVIDIIGSGKDDKGNDYDFDFINDPSRLTMKVGGKELTAEKIEGKDNQFGFGKKADGSYTYMVEYIQKDENGKEKLIWNIYAPVSNFEPVQLTYALKLVNPQTTAGTYGQYDADGSKGYDGLYTNESATLIPVDTDGNEGAPQEFNKPTVSYTVEKTEPENPPTDEPTTPGTTDPGNDQPTTPPTTPPTEEPGTTVDPEPTEPDIEEPIDEEPTEDPVDEEPTEEPEETDNDTATETNNDSGLPQTGQDWMMVSVLLIAGVAILVVGFTMKRRKVED